MAATADVQRAFDIAVQTVIVEEDVDRFVDVPEVARRLSLHPDTVRKMIRDEEFPVPVRTVGGKKVVSLRRLVDWINAEAAA
jgi:predicted DNA-binding transcriptional regulator AlpA